MPYSETHGPPLALRKVTFARDVNVFSLQTKACLRGLRMGDEKIRISSNTRPRKIIPPHNLHLIIMESTSKKVKNKNNLANIL